MLEKILQEREALIGDIYVNEQKHDIVIGAYDAVIDVLRTYSRSQKELWQQIPYWALEAQWRGDYYSSLSRRGDERFQRAYEKSRWRIDERSGKSISVDLTNGELLRRKPSTGYQLERAANSDILPVVKSGWFIDVLDAQNLLSFFKEKTKYPQRSWGPASPEDIIERRAKIRKRYNIKEIL